MNDLKKGGPGGLRGREKFMGGRPAGDANYGAKKKFDKKPAFGGAKGGSKGGFKGGDRGGFGGNRDAGRRETEMFKATCSTCKKACEVPFKPDGSKPVLCRDCFSNSRDERPDRRPERRDEAPRGDRNFGAPRAPQAPSPDLRELKEQVSRLETKVNEVLALLQASPTAAEPSVAKAPKKTAVKKVVKKVAKKVVKKSPAKKK